MWPRTGSPCPAVVTRSTPSIRTPKWQPNAFRQLLCHTLCTQKQIDSSYTNQPPKWQPHAFRHLLWHWKPPGLRKPSKDPFVIFHIFHGAIPRLDVFAWFLSAFWHHGTLKNAIFWTFQLLALCDCGKLWMLNVSAFGTSEPSKMMNVSAFGTMRLW